MHRAPRTPQLAVRAYARRGSQPDGRDTSPVAVCDLGYARSGTRGKHLADVTLPLRSSFKLRRADGQKTPQGRWCVYYLRGLEEDTKEKKEVRECAWCMLDRSHLKTL